MSADSRKEPANTGQPAPGTEPLDCAQIQAVLTEYAARELGPGPTLLVREHLRHCTACQAEAAALAATLSLLKAGDPGQVAPSVLSDDRRRRVLWAWTHPLLAWCVRWHHWISLAMAVIVLLAVFAALRQWNLFGPPPPQGINVQLQVPGPVEPPPTEP